MEALARSGLASKPSKLFRNVTSAMTKGMKAGYTRMPTHTHAQTRTLHQLHRSTHTRPRTPQDAASPFTSATGWTERSLMFFSTNNKDGQEDDGDDGGRRRQSERGRKGASARKGGRRKGGSGGRSDNIDKKSSGGTYFINSAHHAFCVCFVFCPWY